MERIHLLEEQLKRNFQGTDCIIDQEKAEKLYRFYEMVVEKNKVMNLTAITEYDEFVTKHLIDSLMIGKYVEVSKFQTMLDVGTGAGFPGIPLKIAYPELEIVLLDSLQKRLTFLDDVIKELGLEKIQTIHARAEELQSKGKHRAHYDLAVSRAVANLATLSEFCIPYVKKGGYFIPYKSRGASEELEQARYAVKVLGGKIEDVHSFTLPDTDMERELIVIKKIQDTPAKYPRSGGKPMKQPLQAAEKKTDKTKMSVGKRG